MVGFTFAALCIPTPMKTAFAACIVSLACALGGCKQPASETPAQPAAEAPAKPSAATQPAQPASRLDKAQILASGKTGLWAAEGDSVCAGPTRARMTLAWNVKDATRARVVVWLDRASDGKERAVKNAAAVDVFTTGPWVRPGTVFVLREAGTRRELARLKVGSKKC